MSSVKDSKHNVEDAAGQTDPECESLLHHIEVMRLKKRLSQSPIKVSPAIKVTLSSGHRSTACAAGLELDSPVPPAASPTTTVSALCNSPTDTSGASSSLDIQQQQEVFESELNFSLHQLTISEGSTNSNNDKSGNGKAPNNNVEKAQISADEASPTSAAPSTHPTKATTANNNNNDNSNSNDNPPPTPLPISATDTATAATTATDLSAWQMMMPTPGKLSLPFTTTNSNKNSNTAAASRARAAPSSSAYAYFPSPPSLPPPHKGSSLVEDQNYNSQQFYGTNNSYLNTYYPQRQQPSQAVQGASISSLAYTAAGLGYAPSSPPPPPPPPPSSSSISGRPLAPLHHYQQQQQQQQQQRQGQQQTAPLSASAASFYQQPPPPLPTSYLTGDIGSLDGNAKNNNINTNEDFQVGFASVIAQQEQDINMQLLITAYNNNPIPLYGPSENNNNHNCSNENQGGYPYTSSSSFSGVGTGTLGLGGLATDHYLYNSLTTGGNMMMNNQNSNTGSHSSQSLAPPRSKGTTNNAAGINIDGDTIDPQLMSLLFQQQHQLLQLQQQEQRELFAMTEPEECLVGLEGLYQPYCSQIITQNLNTTTFSLLSKLRDSQLTDPPNAYYGKRFFCSLKEVSKVVYRGCQAIIVAPDIKPSTTANIKPVRLLYSILQAATDSGVPVIFALSRRGIGRVFGRDKSMSIVAVMMIDGVEREFADMLSYAAEGRKEHRRYYLNNNNNEY